MVPLDRVRPRSWVRSPLSITIAVRSVTLSCGAPHFAQHPHSEVPALMHGSTSAGGKVAKCAPANGAAAIVQTERLLRNGRS